jgi:two-component system, NtrC family, sensor kinase
MMRGIAAKLFRDWRVRTLVPVIIIHLAAFAALYTLMFKFAVSNLISTQRFGANVVLDEVEFDFPDMMLNHHGASSLPMRMAVQANRHSLATLNVYDFAARPVVSTRGKVLPLETSVARDILGKQEKSTTWQTDESNGTLLVGTRTIDGEAVCHQCHDANAPHLGAIQLGVDLTAPMREAKRNVQVKFGLVGAAWIALVVLMSWIRMLVIGRPLAEIQKTISAAGSGSGGAAGSHDLTALAEGLHSTLWELVQSQRRREEDIARQLVRMEKLAALGEVAAGLTHEIKNPLAGVIAALEIVRDESSGGDRGMIEQMLAELRRVVSTVDSLLRLGRPRPPQRADVDMARVVREVTSLFAARLRRQGITLDVEIPETVPLLSLDSDLMVQLLVNLLTNSMQASDRGGSVKVLLAPFPRRDGVVLAVSDTGRGIEREHIEQVFDPFFTTKEEGTGLGLAICRQIINQHGGTITIESEPGQGTRVVVLLAAQDAAAPLRATATTTAAGEEPGHAAAVAG